MVRQTRKVQADVDSSGVVAAFLFGAIVGFGMLYPTFPEGTKLFDFSLNMPTNSIAGPLIGGVGLFLLFFIGVFVLNWLFIETGD